MDNKIHEIIKDKRILLGLTQEQVAEKARISATYLSDFERGKRKNISMRIFADICRALNTSIDDVFGISETSASPSKRKKEMERELIEGVQKLEYGKLSLLWNLYKYLK